MTRPRLRVGILFYCTRTAPRKVGAGCPRERVLSRMTRPRQRVGILFYCTRTARPRERVTQKLKVAQVKKYKIACFKE